MYSFHQSRPQSSTRRAKRAAFQQNFSPRDPHLFSPVLPSQSQRDSFRAKPIGALHCSARIAAKESKRCSSYDVLNKRPLRRCWRRATLGKIEMMYRRRPRLFSSDHDPAPTSRHPIVVALAAAAVLPASCPNSPMDAPAALPLGLPADLRSRPLADAT
jgi:hypothetical protein